MLDIFTHQQRGSIKLEKRKQKRGKKMLYIILVVIATISLIIWGIIAYLGRSQTLTVASIEK